MKKHIIIALAFLCALAAYADWRGMFDESYFAPVSSATLPTITVQPVNLGDHNPPYSGQFSIETSGGTQPLTYQWQFHATYVQEAWTNCNTNYVLWSGTGGGTWDRWASTNVNQEIYAFSYDVYLASDHYYFRCIVSNPAGVITSDVSTINVTADLL